MLIASPAPRNHGAFHLPPQLPQFIHEVFLSGSAHLNILLRCAPLKSEHTDFNGQGAKIELVGGLNPSEKYECQWEG